MRWPALFRRRIVRDGAWVAAGQIASALAAVVSIRIMSELLEPEAFGHLVLLVGLAGLALGICATPRLQAIIRYYPDAVRDDSISSLRSIGLRLISPLVAGAAVVLAVGWLVAGPRLGEPWFTGALIAAMLVVDCLRSFELAFFSAARRQRAAALVYVADAWSRPLSAIGSVLVFGSSVESALAGYVLGSGAVVLAMYFGMHLEGRGGRLQQSQGVAPQKKAELSAAIKRYALPLAPLAIFGWLSGMGDRYVVAGLLDLHNAGLYAAAYGLASRPFLMLGGVVELTMRPVLQNAAAAKDTELVARAKSAWLRITILASVFGVACFVLLSEWVGYFLLAEQYRSATALMPWIALGYALYCVATVFTRFCFAFDDTRAVFWIVVCGSVIGIAAMVPAVYLEQLQGAGYAVSVSFGIQLILSFVLARRAEMNFFSDPPRA